MTGSGVRVPLAAPVNILSTIANLCATFLSRCASSQGTAAQSPSIRNLRRSREEATSRKAFLLGGNPRISRQIQRLGDPPRMIANNSASDSASTGRSPRSIVCAHLPSSEPTPVAARTRWLANASSNPDASRGPFSDRSSLRRPERRRRQATVPVPSQSPIPDQPSSAQIRARPDGMS